VTSAAGVEDGSVLEVFDKARVPVAGSSADLASIVSWEGEVIVDRCGAGFDPTAAAGSRVIGVGDPGEA